MIALKSCISGACAVVFLLSPLAFGQVPDTLTQTFLPPPTGTQPNMKESNSVAVDGALVVVGAPDDDLGGSNAGSVRVYDLSTGTLSIILGLKRSINLENSTDVVTFEPFPFTMPALTITPEGKIEFEFTPTDNAAFFRLEAK